MKAKGVEFQCMRTRPSNQENKTWRHRSIRINFLYQVTPRTVLHNTHRIPHDFPAKYNRYNPPFPTQAISRWTWQRVEIICITSQLISTNDSTYKHNTAKQKKTNADQKLSGDDEQQDRERREAKTNGWSPSNNTIKKQWNTRAHSRVEILSHHSWSNYLNVAVKHVLTKHSTSNLDQI
jgi:hypothetical protein